MIRINKTKVIPESLENLKFQKHLKKFLKEEVSVSGDYYGALDVRASLDNEYNNKCAYCETIDYKMEIEHYRPKSKYKYLSYEWTNLMPACHNCNHSKLNKFPVKNSKIIDDINNSGSVKDLEKLNLIEEPYVINPEVDYPNEHFTFNIQGEILAKTERAEQTIKICNLNDKTLIYRRQKSYNDLLEIIKIAKLSSNKISAKVLEIIKNKINLKQKKESEYSLFWQNVAENLENQIIKY